MRFFPPVIRWRLNMTVGLTLRARSRGAMWGTRSLFVPSPWDNSVAPLSWSGRSGRVV